MNMKKFMAAFAAAAVSASAFAAMAISANAAEKEIPYNGASDGAYKVESIDLRLNILNTWGNSIEDIDGNVGCNEYVKVNFTISGLGDQVCNKNEDGTDADSYYAYLGGAIGANAARHTREEAEAAGDSVVDITGDGDYTATFNLAEGADTIMCLYLHTNINVYNREGFDGTDPASTGINISVNSITTDDGEEAPTEGETDPATTTAAAEGSDAKTTTTAAPKNDDKKTTTAKADDKKAATTAAAEASAQTGDAGVAVALVALGAAAATAFVVRKRK